MDVDATITIDYSDRKGNSAATWTGTYGFHQLLIFLDRPDIAAGEALAGLLRSGNAGSSTTADHIRVLGEALAALPEPHRPRPADPNSPRLLMRSDSAGATNGFARACRDAGVGFSFGFPVTAPVRAAVQVLAEAATPVAEHVWTVWYPAVEADGGIRNRAWLAEVTGLVDLSAWPGRTRLILRKELPPGAQLTDTDADTDADADGHRVTAFITDTPIGAVPGQLAGLDLRHRQHARVEDRIRQDEASGLRNLARHSWMSDSAWLEIVLTATDLVAWRKLIAFADQSDPARCEIAALCYRVLHVEARISRAARQTRLRIDRTWRWATAIATARHRFRAAFP